MDPLELTLTELVDALRRREISAVDVMEATLARADATHEQLNAFVACRDRSELVDEARAADARIAEGGARALEGVPLGVKDLEEAAGLVCAHGSRLFEDHRVDEDSIQVARLVAAGAIVFGKTATPEFGSTAITKSLVHGVTRSPWGEDVSPGGSSGGSAALVAAEVLALVTGSDGGGSVRIPASFTGCFGVKPSYGRIPIWPRNHWDYGATAVMGTLTKTVADAALILDVVAGPDGRDPTSLPHPGYRYAERLDEAPRALRIGLSPDLGYGVVQSDVAARVEEAARVVEGLGHRLVAIDGGPPEMGATWALLGAYELGAELHDTMAGREGDMARSLASGIAMARGITPQWWGKASQERQRVVAWCASVFSAVDVLITPTTPFDAPPAKGPFPAETEGKKQPTASAGSFTIPFNLSWHPAVSVRAGLSERGLPVGMQMVGPHHREDLLLALARSYERERPWHPAWPGRKAG